MIPFVCKIQNHAQIMGELSYILLNTISPQVILDLFFIWYTSSDYDLFVILFSLGIFSNWRLIDHEFIWFGSNWYLLSCVDLDI